MCRLLVVKSKTEFDPEEYLTSFARMCEKSKEYQGHGWGYSLLTEEGWKVYHNVNPVWEDNFSGLGNTRQILVHARSAFKDEGIVVENNMPFYDDNYQFIFNGELQGVKIKEEGRIGAEKIFNYIKRFDKGDIYEALKKGVDILGKKTRYIRAMNIIISDKSNVFVNCMYNEDPGYFNLRYNISPDISIVCSEQLDVINEWFLIPNNSIMVIE